MSLEEKFEGKPVMELALQTKFHKAVALIANPPADSVKATIEQKLKIYALYKQATMGDINTPQPWAVQVEARAKWDAWNLLKGKEKTECMEHYIQLLQEINPEWEHLLV